MSDERIIKDDGCELHPKCLTCSFSMCIHDVPTDIIAWIKRGERNKIIKRAALSVGVKGAAQLLGLSVRTVRRALAGDGE